MLLAALAGYAVLLAVQMGAYAGGSDSSGYLNNARLLRAGRLRIERREIPGVPTDKLPAMTYVPLGFIPEGARDMVPTYPVGLSLFFVGLAPVTGRADAAPVTIWLHALAGVLLMYALARAVALSPPWAALGAILLAACPLYLFIGLQALSDVPALAWCTAAVLWAWYSQERPRWALAAGGAVAVAVLVRPSNLLVMLPIALCLGTGVRRWLWLGLGGLPGAVFLALLNRSLYGSALTTGYGAVEHIFGWSNVPPSLENYAVTLPAVLTPAVVLVLALPRLARGGDRLLAAVLAAWILGFAGFYAFYFHTHEAWWYLRFLLPAFPAFIIAMLLAGRALAVRCPPRLVAIGAVLVVTAAVLWEGFWSYRKHSLTVGDSERKYVDVTRWAQAHLPASAIVAAMQTSGAMFYYTPFTLVRYEQLGAEHWPAIERAAAAAGRPIYAVLFPFELKAALETSLPGRWTQVGAVKDVTFWRLDGPEPTPVTAAPRHELFTIQAAGLDVTTHTAEGWFEPEHSLLHTWMWSSGTGQLEFETWPLKSSRAKIEFSLRSLAPCTVTVSQDGAVLWRGPVGSDRTPVAFSFPVKDGRARLEFASDQPAQPESTLPGARLLTFAVYDPKLTVTGDAR